MLELKMGDPVLIRGNCCRVYVLHPGNLKSGGDWSNPSVRRAFGTVPFVQKGATIKVDGRAACIRKNGTTSPLRLVWLEDNVHASTTPCALAAPPRS